ncbi:ABC transporter permease [Paenibacillus sp. R14(2021)]|uniref:ABC transporter permease n=1 Tax=Paenibacillus sp. R14(2021) TaxID=2859228 RepID=UPI0035BE4505
MRYRSIQKHYHVMLIPGIALLILFSIIPMFGALIAFQDFKIGLGIWKSPWVGLDNFKYMFELPDSKRIFINTLILATSKIAANLVIPLVFAIMLNELRKQKFKRIIQTIVYLPHFLSWVILAGVISDLLLLDGPVNRLATALGYEPVMFLVSNKWFPSIIISTDVWKEFGFNAIIYLAALAGVNPSLFEAAEMDGATRIQQIWHVTLPSLRPTIVLLATLAIGNVLNAGFDQILNMYSPLVYESGDVIDTYVYRAGILDGQYGLATAVGLLKSAIAFVLIMMSYHLASRFANYRIF